MRETKIIAICNEKGGSGKTTTTINLGDALAQAGKRVLLVDNDHQGNTTLGLGLTPTDLKHTLKTVMVGALNDPDGIGPLLDKAIVHRNLKGGKSLDLIPANKKLRQVDRQLVLLQSGQAAFGTDQEDESGEFVLRTVFNQLAGLYDYMLIDCGPSPDMLVLNALVAATHVIIPVQAEYYALEGVPGTLDNVAYTKSHFNPNLEVAGILLTMCQSGTNLAAAVAEEVRDRYGESVHVFRSRIGRHVMVAEQPAHGLTIREAKSTAPAALSYQELAKEVMKYVGKRPGQSA